MGARFAARRSVLGVGIISVISVALVACGNPTTSVARCVGAPNEAVRAISRKLDPSAGTLRNAKMVTSSGFSFLSAELHAVGDAKHDEGDILTSATRSAKSGDFVSVDVHAREYSSWPIARFDVTKKGVIESRACTGLNRGKTRAQIRCDQEQATGDVQVGPGRDCTDL